MTRISRTLALRTLLGVAVLVTALTAWPAQTDATGESYTADADFAGCVVSPGGASPTTSATCTPADSSLVFPNRVAAAGTTLSFPPLAVDEIITIMAGGSTSRCRASTACR
jgi:hypothetical protein